MQTVIECKSNLRPSPQELQQPKGMNALDGEAVAAVPALPQIVSLFCGAGGLDWGFHQEGFKIPLAIDISDAAILTHRKNFSNTHSVAADLIELGPKGVLSLVKKQIPAKTC